VVIYYFYILIIFFWSKLNLIFRNPSPVLTKYFLVFFPLITEMFHFIRFLNKIIFYFIIIYSFLVDINNSSLTFLLLITFR